MKSKIQKAINDPKYAMHILISRYFSINFLKKSFAHKSEYRSDSENGNYSAAVENALKDQKSFNNFKRNGYYREILEHVSREQGQEYINIVLSRNDGFFEKAVNSVFKMDEVGNPVKYKYSVLNASYELSPTTLRYLKVASDLNGLFGGDVNNIAEIGCGYGGQALVNDQFLNINLVTCFDLPVVNKLITRYLDSMLLKGAYKVAAINQALPENYDLVISNYAFSELPSMLQRVYIKKIMSNSRCGYITMNSGLNCDRSPGKLNIDQLREMLPTFEVYEEEPKSSEFNYIILWGHNKEFARNNLKLKIIP